MCILSSSYVLHHYEATNEIQPQFLSAFMNIFQDTSGKTNFDKLQSNLDLNNFAN